MIPTADHTTSTSLLERALRVLFPPRCAGCGLWCDELFCASCRADLKPIAAPLCAICGLPFDALAQVLQSSVCADCRANRYHEEAPPLQAMRAPFEYSGAIREAIHAFKYRGKTSRADELANLLCDYLIHAPEGQALPLADLQLIVPVPLHSWRQWRRGYNQSTLLARELAKQLKVREGLDVAVAEVLRRVRHTTPQVELSAKAREQNIKGAFALYEARWTEYSALQRQGAILLLDDVGTTGATLFEGARALQKFAGLQSSQIFALTLAR